MALFLLPFYSDDAGDAVTMVAGADAPYASEARLLLTVSAEQLQAMREVDMKLRAVIGDAQGISSLETISVGIFSNLRKEKKARTFSPSIKQNRQKHKGRKIGLRRPCR